MNALKADLTTDVTTRDALRLLELMTDRLHAAVDAVERDLDEHRGTSADDQ